MQFQPSDILVVLLVALGPSSLIWSCVGLARFVSERFSPAPPSRMRKRPAIKIDDVAVIIAARNEEVALPKCIKALRRIFKARQIHIASDGSSDATVRLARKARCRVIDIQPNGGKARALARGIEEFGLCDGYKAILIQDADSEIDPDYMKAALKLFDNPEVAAVAGHVVARWNGDQRFSPSMVFTAYRTRLYIVLQAIFRYGQSWSRVNANYIAPGFASMYRSSVLRQIDITRPGLVIEDFNMTFEVHRKRLGIVAYTPGARCSTEDPHRARDYVRQVQRWYLGLWQTVYVHGFWPSLFSVALATMLIDMVAVALFQLVLPIAVLAFLAFGVELPTVSLGGIISVNPLTIAVALLVCDYALTCLVALIDRRPSLLVHGLAFPALRLLDVFLFLQAAVKATTRSDGTWISPHRLPGQGAASYGAPLARGAR